MVRERVSQMVKVPVGKPLFGREELENVTDAVSAGWFSSLGGYVTEFEEVFAGRMGLRHGVSCNSGTAALHLAMLALGISEGDEVIVPSLTYVATGNVVRYCRATPVLVDVDRETWCIDTLDLRRKLTPRTKAIVPVHLYGNPCNMDELAEISRDAGIPMVEDCAEAHGAIYKGKPVSTYGEISCFSFFGNKHVTTGEGGMCLTNNAELAERMRYFRNQCVEHDRQYWHEEVGYNYRMSNLQAAVGVAQVKRLDKVLEMKRWIHGVYRDKLRDVESSGLISFQRDTEGSEPAYWMVSISLGKADIKRDDLIVGLAERGVDSRPVFYPLHVLPPFRSRDRLTVSEDISSRGISLPSGPDISEEDLGYVCECVISLIGM